MSQLEKTRKRLEKLSMDCARACQALDILETVYYETQLGGTTLRAETIRRIQSFMSEIAHD